MHISLKPGKNSPEVRNLRDALRLLLFQGQILSHDTRVVDELTAKVLNKVLHELGFIGDQDEPLLRGSMYSVMLFIQ